MAYTTGHIANTQSGLATRVTTFVEAVKARHARRKVFKQTYSELAALSNRDLADLGLARSEIRRIAWQAANEV